MVNDSSRPESSLEVIDPKNILTDMSDLFLSNQFSDAVFIVDQQRLPVHKVVLAARSEYFRALLFSGMKESQQTEIVMNVSSISAFKLILSYLYCLPIKFSDMNDQTILELFRLSHEYSLIELVDAIAIYLEHILCIENVVKIYQNAQTFNISGLSQKCLTLIDENALEVIESDYFNDLSAVSLKEIIKRDTFFVLEIEIFRAFYQWIQKNSIESIEIIKDVSSVIRWPLISTTNLITSVRKTGILDNNQICDIIEIRKQSEKCYLNERTSDLLNQNVVTLSLRAEITNGNQYNLLERHLKHFEPMFIKPFETIFISFGKKYIINNIRFKIMRKSFSLRKKLVPNKYSFYIEVTADMNTWNRIIERSKSKYGLWHNLFFPKQVVRFIRLVFSPVNEISDYESDKHILQIFECMFSDTNNKPEPKLPELTVYD